MFLLPYAKDHTLHAKPFTHIFIVCCILKNDCKSFYHYKRNLLEVMTLPVGSREAETWEQ